jgi:hypothetical protein
MPARAYPGAYLGEIELGMWFKRGSVRLGHFDREGAGSRRSARPFKTPRQSFSPPRRGHGRQHGHETES